MRCREFERLVHDLAHRREFDPALAAVARAHSEICPSCSYRLADTESLAGLLRTAAHESRPFETPPQVEARLLRVFRQQSAARSKEQTRKRFVWRLAFGGAGGALVLALIALAFWIRLPRRAPAGLAGERTAATAIASTPSPSGPSTQNQRLTSQASLTSGFVPVPYSESFGPDDSAVIVRVQVPRSSLAELGYPLYDAQGSGTVQADLVIGEDGWPRAVRIVQ